MDMLRSNTSKAIVVPGLLSGAFLLFTGAVGMIAAFHEREVVDRFISLGQLMLLAAPFVTAFVAARRLPRSWRDASQNSYCWRRCRIADGIAQRNIALIQFRRIPLSAFSHPTACALRRGISNCMGEISSRRRYTDRHWIVVASRRPDRHRHIFVRADFRHQRRLAVGAGQCRPQLGGGHHL